jgi:hypothetical protein
MKTFSRSTWALTAAVFALIAPGPCPRAAAQAAAKPAKAEHAETELSAAQSRANELVEKDAESRIEARQEDERLKKDLRYMSEELDRETLDDEETAKSLQAYSSGGLARLAGLRAHGNIDPRLLPILDQLENLYRDLAKKEYAKDFAGSLVKAIDEELRVASETAADSAQMIDILKLDLVLPDKIPQDGDVEDLAFFPVDLPVAKFLKLGPIKIFLMKHRLKRPRSMTRTTAEDLIGGKHNVQIGVEVEGTVTWAHKFLFDQDYCFNFGDLHMEITPEWRLKHPGFIEPKVGQKIRVKGWSYYDYFHKSELEYDPADPVLGVLRSVVWEIHPVQEIEVLP